jgi:hypothetical protein
MMRALLLTLSFAACSSPETLAESLPTGQAPVPVLTLSAPAQAVPGSRIELRLTGASNGEPVYFGFSTTGGRPQCIPAAGGLCLDIATPARLAGQDVADADGQASLTLRLPPTVPTGTRVDLQAIIIRGLGGAASVASNATTMQIVADIFGCTDPAANNYDPAATADDGSCATTLPTTPSYSGPAGPDLSADGWTLCSGTSSGATDYAAWYTPCDGASTVRFACSIDADATAEYFSTPAPIAAQSFLDDSCDDWPGGSSSVYGTGRILSIDDTDPGCDQYNVAYDLYMDMVSPQWGCAGVYNTHTTGGRMWMYGRFEAVAGCTDPAASNYEPTATQDDGSCAYGATVPGFNGVLGPDLSAQGFLQCGGTSSAGTTSAEFYALCEGYSEIVFACSTDANAVAEFTSPAFPIAGGALADGACDDWSAGSNSPYFSGHILSVDPSNPGCGQYDVSYQLYMDMVSPQWGCAGVYNTHTTGGRMWAYVR